MKDSGKLIPIAMIVLGLGAIAYSLTGCGEKNGLIKDGFHLAQPGKGSLNAQGTTNDILDSMDRRAGQSDPQLLAEDPPLDEETKEVIRIYDEYDQFVTRVFEENYQPSQREVDVFVERMFYAYQVEGSDIGPEKTSYVAIAQPLMVKLALQQFKPSESLNQFKLALRNLLLPEDQVTGQD